MTHRSIGAIDGQLTHDRGLLIDLSSFSLDVPSQVIFSSEKARKLNNE